MNRGQFGLVSVIHAFQSDRKYQAAFEEKSTQTRAGTGLNFTTIFESFLPSKSFWFKHTHAQCVFALGLLQGKLSKLMNGSMGNGVSRCNAKPATSE